MLVKVLLIVLLGICLVINIATAAIFDGKEMYRRFIKGQCVVGRICANVFYAPAWFLKGLKFVVSNAIK